MPMLLDPERAGPHAKNLESKLHRFIAGQEEAIQQIVSIYQMHRVGLTGPNRPIGSFLFLGPTGSGKTRTVEATAQCLVNNPLAVTKIDCGEFQHSHEIAKLIGSPPGYLGHRETRPLLAQEALNQHHTDRVKISFVLFDEIEKASDALWNLLLGILDKATLTLGHNRKVDFSRCMIFMTSNLGAVEAERLLTPGIGFAGGDARVSHRVDEVNVGLGRKMTRTSLDAARRKFSPEFINRLDKIVVFNTLGTRELYRILEIELGLVQERVMRAVAQKPFTFSVTDRGKAFLLDKGADLRYGARRLKRAIERFLVHPLCNLIATDQIQGGDWIEIDHIPGAADMVFVLEAEGMPAQGIATILSQPDFLQHSAAASFDEDRAKTTATPADSGGLWGQIRAKAREFCRYRFEVSRKAKDGKIET
jgi:ATP-dependent Clp protease ATP-binding subunit ClpB